VEPAKKKKNRVYSRVRICIVIVFLFGYVALVAFLASTVVTEQQKQEGIGRDSPECRQLLCPVDSPCQLENGEAQCLPFSTANLRAMELILGIVVGVPSMICIPCAVQWLLRSRCPKSWERLGKGGFWDRACQDTERGAMLGKPLDADPPGLPSPAGRESQETQETQETQPDDPDDGLKDLFMPLAKGRSQPPEEELDVLFAAKPRKPKEEEPSLREALPTGPPKPASETDLESAFSQLFHKRATLPKARRQPEPHSEVTSQLRSEFSEGVSVLFAAMQAKKKPSKSARSERSTKSAKSSRADPDALGASQVGSCLEGDFLDEDLGDPPDFFGFALRVSSSMNDAKSKLHDRDHDSDDSLGHMRPSDMSELFHPSVEGW